MLINDEQKWVYISPPKTASSSLTKYFLQHGGKDADPNDRHSVDMPIEANAYYKFASVRNPYGRAASLWRYYIMHIYRWKYRNEVGWYTHIAHDTSIRDGFPFQVFISHMVYNHNAWFPFYTYSLQDWLGDIELDAVLHMENLVTDISNLPFIEEVGCIPIANVSQHHQPLRVIYDASTSQLVKEWARDGFDRFGYSRDDYGGEW